MKSGKYYNEVASYYDDDAKDFEQRYEQNPILQIIRESFRRVTEKFPFNTALEIGCGPGFDVEYFADRYPSRKFFAIDVSPGMIELTRKRCERANLNNVQLGVGSVEDITSVFPDQKFDLIYVYFGGLNTVFNLEEAVKHLEQVCTEDARLVVTFVNRYYITEIPLWLANGRFDKAFERITNKWRGYSDHRKIPSRPYSYGDIKKAFNPVFHIGYKRGYSIFYPAWYRSHLLKKLGNKAGTFWKLDKFLSKTPLWNSGEYSLYEMWRKKKDLVKARREYDR
ncbi:MAG: class I SAM-dependent methyltransferase [Balneolales bacterium]|nr:class I SAM-dependent methyltransferase [Balneolales bacterium]